MVREAARARLETVSMPQVVTNGPGMAMEGCFSSVIDAEADVWKHGGTFRTEYRREIR